MVDGTKTLLFIALMLVAVMLVTSGGKRPTASTPIDGATPTDESQGAFEASDPVTPTWAANVAPAQYPPPLLLMIPETGEQGPL